MVFPSFDETLNKSTKIDKDRETRPHVLNPSYATPTSLPLYFYFGYQLLQESNSLEKFGDVRQFYSPLSLIFLKKNIRACV